LDTKINSFGLTNFLRQLTLKAESEAQK
jgi:hypothetical protein